MKLTLLLIAALSLGSCTDSEIYTRNSALLDSSAGLRIQLNTIGFNALRDKVVRVFALPANSPAVVFLDQNRNLWVSQNAPTESKFRLLLDLGNKICNETNLSTIGLDDPKNVGPLFTKLTGRELDTDFAQALSTKLDQSGLTAVGKQEFACIATWLDARNWVSI